MTRLTVCSGPLGCTELWLYICYFATVVYLMYTQSSFYTCASVLYDVCNIMFVQFNSFPNVQNSKVTVTGSQVAPLSINDGMLFWSLFYLIGCEGPEMYNTNNQQRDHSHWILE